MEALIDKSKKILEEVFGYKDFRLDQETIINRTLAGKDSLVIMPTGGGKSLCFQIPALTLEGTAVVVSPLIALMEDQVLSLLSNGIKAVALHSGVDNAVEQKIVNELIAGEIKILYVSPERAVSANFAYLLSKIQMSLLAIDEAHCVSMWGNDFRKEYTMLHQLIEAYPNIPHIALTATADKATQVDIADKLKMNDPELFLASFERSNLSLSVRPANDRIKVIENFVERRPSQPGIVYCLSKKSTEQVAEKLNQAGFKADFYHASMTYERKSMVHKAFLNDEIQIVCATIAFGMGVDKSNIRWVIHYNLPKNIEGYYQEIGRAGRDGMPGEAMLFYTHADVILYKDFIENSTAPETFKSIQRAKLDRMLEFAQGYSCRTNMVLSYFGEHREKGCGRCDICRNPPAKIDGTIIAQKALSAIIRTQQSINMGLLMDILRGSARQEIIANGYDQIKTYGAGKDISLFDWTQYINQMVNEGLIEIDYANKSRLLVTELAKPVLFDNKKVWLKQAISYQERQDAKSKKVPKTVIYEDELLTKLKVLRKEIATRKEIPPYSVFTDATLQAIVDAKPLTLEEMSELSGVGAFKLKSYGALFLEVVQQHTLGTDKPLNIKGKTYLETMVLYQSGLHPDEIAEKRSLNVVTIYSHLAHLYEKGEAVNLKQYVSEETLKEVQAAWKALGHTTALKEIYEYLNATVSYHEVRLSLAILQKNK